MKNAVDGPKKFFLITKPPFGLANPLSATDQPYRAGDLGFSFAPRDFRSQVALSLRFRKPHSLENGRCLFYGVPHTEPLQILSQKL